MSLFRDGPSRAERDEPVIGHEEWRPALRSRPLATGTLACARCDAPVAPPSKPLAVTAPLSCPFCLHGGLVRDFLSLSDSPRPARVRLRVVARGRRLAAT